MTELRHTNFTGEPKADATLAAENARDANSALGEKLTASIVKMQYTATGATTSGIPIVLPARPTGVILLNGYLGTSPADDLGAVSRCNFRWDGASSSAYVFEPSGLTTDSVYFLTFLVVG